MNDKYRLLDQIIEGHFITPVFQPIASLKDGRIYGYEALSRISNPSLSMNIEEMFQIADECNKSWALETLCRTKALEHLEYWGMDKKLFSLFMFYPILESDDFPVWYCSLISRSFRVASLILELAFLYDCIKCLSSSPKFSFVDSPVNIPSMLIPNSLLILYCFHI
jgi:EAL domain-containing protein (putative c-di-GMP-specific phosphodiesterase class I)